MNIFLWVLQVLLALHTAIGAIWKASNSEQTVPALSAIPHPVWLAMIAFEMLCSIALIIPVLRNPVAILAPIAAACIALEMLLFTGLSISSGHGNSSEIAYWLVVAALAAFIAYGRLVLKPF